jgi:hypothetical protein
MRRVIKREAGLVTMTHEPAPLRAEPGQRDPVASAAALHRDRGGPRQRRGRVVAVDLGGHAASLAGTDPGLVSAIPRSAP